MKKRAIKKIVHEDVVVEVNPPESKKVKTKKKVETDEAKLTFDEAVSLLGVHISKRKKRVHTFVGGGLALLGCDVDLTHIKKALKETDHICLSGPNMTGMGHGVAFWNPKGYWEFISTDKEKLAAIYKERKIKM